MGHENIETKINNLKLYKPHITNICKIITSALFIINRVKWFLPHEALKTLYALIHSHIIYGIQAWGGNPVHSNQVYILQKRAIRINNNKGNRHHTETLFKNNNILKYPALYKLQVSTHMNNLNYKHLPKKFNNVFSHNSSITNINTR